MNKYIAQFARFLEADDWSFSKESHGNDESIVDYLRAGWRGRNTRLDLVVDANEESDIVWCFVYLPVQVPEGRRMDIAELFCRLNKVFSVGLFELDFDDGEVRYRQSIDMEGGELTETMFRNMRSTALQTGDRYFPTIMHVIYGGKAAKDALQELDDNEGVDAKCNQASLQ